MTNYYEEFAEIDQHDSSAEIMKKLIQLEVIWNKRVSAQPEKAAAKLVIITEAKKVFASENSKKKYDQALFAAPADEKKEDLNFL